MKVTGVDTVRMVPMLIVMGVIFFLSHQPGDALYMPSLHWFDKIAHLAVYALLAISVLYGFFPLLKEKKFSTVTLSVVFFCVLYGISDEFHQSFIPGRFVSIGDVIADGSGAFLACCCWFLWRVFLGR